MQPESSSSLRRLLWIVIFVDVLLTFAPDILLLSGISITPTYITTAEETGSKLPELLEAAIQLVYFLSLTVGWIGMAFLWNPARWLYLFAWIISVTMVGLQGAQAFTALGVNLLTLVGFSGGVLICLVFLTDLRHNFANR